MNTVHAWLAVLASLAAPLLGQAQSITFTNELRSSVVVQTATVVRGLAKRDQPQLLNTGDTSARIPFDGDKIVTIHDGRSSRILYRDAMMAGRQSLRFAIVLDLRTGKVALIKSP